MVELWKKRSRLQVDSKIHDCFFSSEGMHSVLWIFDKVYYIQLFTNKIVLLQDDLYCAFLATWALMRNLMIITFKAKIWKLVSRTPGLFTFLLYLMLILDNFEHLFSTYRIMCQSNENFMLFPKMYNLV